MIGPREGDKIARMYFCGPQPIRGLYAAGVVGQGGLLLEGHGHHLAWAFISGRIAGRNAAFDVPRGKSLAAEMGAVAL